MNTEESRNDYNPDYQNMLSNLDSEESPKKNNQGPRISKFLKPSQIEKLKLEKQEKGFLSHLDTYISTLDKS